MIPFNDILFESQTTDDNKPRLQPRQKYSPCLIKQNWSGQDFQGHLFNENTTLEDWIMTPLLQPGSGSLPEIRERFLALVLDLLFRQVHPPGDFGCFQPIQILMDHNQLLLVREVVKRLPYLGNIFLTGQRQDVQELNQSKIVNFSGHIFPTA